MKLIHASIPADDPGKVAAVLADIMGGEALPFPPVQGGWMAWAGDGSIDLEIVPRGHLIHAGPEEAEWRPVKSAQRLTEVHLAIGVARPAPEIIAIAQAAGWPARSCSRAGLFDLVEVWVENAFMIEFFDPQQAAHFERVVTVQYLKKALAAQPERAA